jgi:hypothetical protein
MWTELRRWVRRAWCGRWLVVVMLAVSCGKSASVVGPPLPPPPPPPPPPQTAECGTPHPGWIWCDDFEQDRLNRYFEYDSAEGGFVRAPGVGVGGSYGMRVRFAAGQVDAGSLHLAMGRVPSNYFQTVDDGTKAYRAG